MSKLINVIFVLAMLVLYGCAPKPLAWDASMRTVLTKYSYHAARSLQPYFKDAKIPLPPARLALLVFKQQKKLEVYGAGKTGPWTYIRSYPVLGASGVRGPKLKQGDMQVPEGIYSISSLNPNSRFHLSIELNYPNAFDQRQAKLAGRDNIGDHIFIHGGHESTGCVAVGDDVIEELFPLVYYVGESHVEVVIAPDDLRTMPAMYSVIKPAWLPVLYTNIKKKLAEFPVPSKERS